MENKSIKFKGNNSSGIKINDDNGFFKLKNNITLEAMIYVDQNLKNGNGGCIISNTEAGGYYLSIGYRGEKQCTFNIKTNNWKHISINNDDIGNGWNRISATYDGYNMKLYLNGILKAQTGESQSIYYPYPNISLVIGNDPNANDNFEYNSGYAFSSNICEVRIWNKALDEKEIKLNWNKYLKGNEDNLIGYWKLNALEKGDIIRDYSKYNHYGIAYDCVISNFHPLLFNILKYLLKQNNQYYSIKEQFYDKENKLYLPCERDFEENGIEDLSELTTNVKINNETFNPIMKFKGEIELIQAEEK